MRLEHCKGCPKYAEGVCVESGKPIARINGCSRSASGRKFGRPKSGAEAVRRKIGLKAQEGAE